MSKPFMFRKLGITGNDACNCGRVQTLKGFTCQLNTRLDSVFETFQTVFVLGPPLFSDFYKFLIMAPTV